MLWGNCYTLVTASKCYDCTVNLYVKLQILESVFPCFQMLQRVIMVAAESLKVLEHQLMDGSQIQDVRVSKKMKKISFTCHSSLHCEPC